MRVASVYIWFDSDASAAASPLVSLVSHMAGHVAVLPSSLVHSDLWAMRVTELLPTDAQPHITTPVTGASARRALVTPMALGSWIDRPVLAPGATVRVATFPREVAQADHRIVVLRLNEEYRPGPFVLDLPMRYVHPRQRMRMLASSDRGALAAEVASALSVELCVVVLDRSDARSECAVIATTDPVAAELIALSLSELAAGVPRGFTGPWEDAVVQRATELQLGVLLPQQMRLIVGGAVAASPWAADVLHHVRMRLGLPASTGNQA